MDEISSKLQRKAEELGFQMTLYSPSVVNGQWYCKFSEIDTFEKDFEGRGSSDLGYTATGSDAKGAIASAFLGLIQCLLDERSKSNG